MAITVASVVVNVVVMSIVMVITIYSHNRMVIYKTRTSPRAMNTARDCEIEGLEKPRQEPRGPGRAQRR
jgi:hypothetical protein